MKKLVMACLLVSALAACQDVVRPTAQDETNPEVSAQIEAPSKPSMATKTVTDGNYTITLYDIIGHGMIGHVITEPGTYEWRVTAEGSTQMEATHFNWYMSTDGGATWEHVYAQSIDSFEWERTSTYSRYIGYSTSSFLLKATAKLGTAYVEGDPAHIEANTPPPPLAVTIEGPDYITDGGFYTWEAMPFSGDGTYTYAWEIEWLSDGVVKPIGTGEKTLSLSGLAGYGAFILYVTVTSAGETAWDDHLVEDMSGM